MSVGQKCLVHILEYFVGDYPCSLRQTSIQILLFDSSFGNKNEGLLLQPFTAQRLRVPVILSEISC